MPVRFLDLVKQLGLRVYERLEAPSAANSPLSKERGKGLSV